MPGTGVTIWATVDLPGYHHWPAAPPHRDYLAARHRHLFRITAWITVRHDDRDTEFHDLAGQITAWWGAEPRDAGPASCETLARALAATLTSKGLPVARTEVSEDGQCGAVYELEPTP